MDYLLLVLEEREATISSASARHGLDPTAFLAWAALCRDAFRRAGGERIRWLRNVGRRVDGKLQDDDWKNIQAGWPAAYAVLIRTWDAEDSDEANTITHPAFDAKPKPAATHSEDFTTVDWFGTRYLFGDGLQAKAVGCLWAEHEKGEHGLSEKTIGEKIGSEASNYRLVSTFRKHPAWNTMIVKVQQGIYRLKKPE